MLYSPMNLVDRYGVVDVQRTTRQGQYIASKPERVPTRICWVHHSPEYTIDAASNRRQITSSRALCR